MNQFHKSAHDGNGVQQKGNNKHITPMKKPIDMTNNLKAKMPKTPTIRKPSPIPELKTRPQTSTGPTRITPKSVSAESEPWSSLLLTNRSNEKVSVFNNFDPLRTLHFLTKELQTRLATVLPDDTNIQQMVADIQIALKRVPPEVSSLLHWQQTCEMTKKAPINKDEKPEKLRNDKMVQTPLLLTGEDTEKIKRFVEKNTIKLETTCKEMEQLCSLYQREKENLEIELDNEKEASKKLDTKIKELEGKISELLGVIRDLKLKNEHLEQINKEAKTSDISLSELTKLKQQKQQLTDDFNTLKQKYTILEMEKERLATLLSLRDGEINEYRTEIEQLQANFLRLDGELANCLLVGDTAGDGTISTITSHGDTSFRELQSGDGLTTSEIFQETLQGGVYQREN